MAMLRKIPEEISRKLTRIDSTTLRVATVLVVNTDQLIKLRLPELGLNINNGELSIPAYPVYPSVGFGSVCKENIEGREIVDKESPKVAKQVYLGDRPIYGDWSNGSFDLWQTRMVYRKILVQPKGLSLTFTCEGYDEVRKTWKLTASINPVLDRKSKNFDSDLLFSLSLLREVVKKVDIFPSDISTTEIASIQVVSWEIFPPGQRDLKSEVLRKIANKSEQEQKIILDRAGTIERLHPAQYVIGSGLASNYYGALFADDFVVFENLDYGNATYLLYDNWQELSRLSRTQLLNGKDNFDRLIHGPNWEKSLKEMVTHELRKRRSKRR